MLAMATVGFAVNFWAWALISPLGPLFRDTGALGTLTESDVALLVAVPVVVGSLGRILVGGLTDRYGGRVMFPLVTGVTILPILFIDLVALDSYALLLVGGFFLGIAGTAFAVGVPFVNAWFPPERRGLAIGIFGAGMGGTAISALTTVKLTTNIDPQAPFLITAGVLAVYAVAAWLMLRTHRAGWRPPRPSWHGSRSTPGCRSPGRPACSTPSPSVGTSRSRSTSRRTSRPPTGSARRRGQPDGRLRAGRRGHAAGRRLALRPVRCGPGAGRRIRRRGRRARGSRRAPRRCTGSGRSPSSRWPPPSGAGSGATFALIAQVTDPPGSAA